ncbi:hypothetical protein [Clostridium sp.]|jgi:hypothetical protein|uniref:hypothetical protein n=1 Tax=Clostridium sp. TaxID=1506 RepID=UPI003A1ABCE9
MNKITANAVNIRTLGKNRSFQNIRFMKNTHLPFKPYSQFDKSKLIERQYLYKEICKKIWDVNKIDALANS